MSAFGGKPDIAAHCSCTMSSRLRRLAWKRIIHPPHFGPCLHAIRSNDLMPPLGWEKSGVEARKCERRLGGASRLMAERPGFGGWGDRSTCLYVTAAPITRNSALGDYPLSLGIGPPKVASQASAQAASTRRRAITVSVSDKSHHTTAAIASTTSRTKIGVSSMARSLRSRERTFNADLARRPLSENKRTANYAAQRRRELPERTPR